ncbi:FHA domain-containing protein [Aggregatilinea lenta]|uniref:FHA domain-containing protein n=1 Tax=Aggregatilinea lenta TaxID=913108 RepID=UPI000E5B41E9|nr:FHA domain-containing protein [Aggregatilinea lenta]
MSETPQTLAKVTWQDPETDELREFVLEEGATAAIGRSPNNQIAIPERHVSRQHAVISYRDGVFVISDLGSANGTFVNDKKLADPFPLVSGDVIRLYVPLLSFSSIVTEEEHSHAKITGTLIVPARADGQPTLHITSGPQEGAEIPLLTPSIRIGRATRNATWDVSLQDRSVSRPHAEVTRQDDGGWAIIDLGSANGTVVNGVPAAAHEPQPIQDGTVLMLGETTMLFRLAD